MDRVILLGIDGIDRLIETGTLENYPSLKQLVNAAAFGTLDSMIPLSWELAWQHALGGIQSPRSDKQDMITEILPHMGASTMIIGDIAAKANVENLLAADILKGDEELVRQATCRKPADKVDLLVIALSGLSRYVKSGGITDDYWSALDMVLAEFLKNLPENTIRILFTPYKRKLSDKGIRINQWLVDNGYAVANAENSSVVDRLQSICFFDTSLNGLKFAPDIAGDVREEIVTKLKALKVLARRGSDLKVVLFEEAFTVDKQADDPDAFVTPRNNGIYLSEELAGAFEYICSVQSLVVSPEGIVYVTGFHVEQDKQMSNISLLAIAPTIMETLTFKPVWRMQRHSFRRQFVRRETQDVHATSTDNASSAVQSRLIALGY